MRERFGCIRLRIGDTAIGSGMSQEKSLSQSRRRNRQALIGAPFLLFARLSASIKIQARLSRSPIMGDYATGKQTLGRGEFGQGGSAIAIPNMIVTRSYISDRIWSIFSPAGPGV